MAFPEGVKGLAHCIFGSTAAIGDCVSVQGTEMQFTKDIYPAEAGDCPETARNFVCLFAWQAPSDGLKRDPLFGPP